FIAEMTAYYKDKGISLYQALINMYHQYGFYKEKLVSITKKGMSGAEEIRNMMERFRNNPPSHLGGTRVLSIKDYAKGQQVRLNDHSTSPLNYPKSDVLQFYTEDGSVISARPSGTEPKIKFYCSVKTDLPDPS